MQVLIVDDQPMNVILVREALGNEFETYVATSGMEALARCLATPPDLILLDVFMPVMDGLETCRRLQEHEQTRDIPVIFVTGEHSSSNEDACWAAGAVDFVSKPINPTTLRHRVRLHLTLKKQADELRQLAFFDPLTHLPNRRHLDDRLARECRIAIRNGSDLSVAILDVDYFKRYNDCYGHIAGDACLVQVAQGISASLVRPGDLVGRYGGEEFICILPQTDLNGALQVAEAIRAGITRLQIPHADSAIAPTISVSIGVASYKDATLSETDLAASLLHAADTALYEAKEMGRARIRGRMVKHPGTGAIAIDSSSAAAHD